MSEQNPENEGPVDETTPEQPTEGSNEPEEVTPEAPQAEQDATESSNGERVTRLGVEYEVTPDHGHRRVR